jgi:hypothetical protein
MLVQEICYEMAEERLRSPARPVPMGAGDLAKAYDRVIERKGLTRFDRLSKSAAGTPGSQMVQLRGGGEETLAMAALVAVARLGPPYETGYDDIRASFSRFSQSASPSPHQMRAVFEGIAQASSPDGRPLLEWVLGRDELAITDPFLMFYMRWVLRDNRKVALPPSARDDVGRIVLNPGSATKDESKS